MATQVLSNATIDRISVAASSGFTSRVGATWSPTLVRTPRVLVPIELDVLMVRNTSLSWAKCGMAVPTRTASGTPLPSAASLIPPPFVNLDAPRPRGAYLQWYLPNGLTSGTADAATNSVQFRPIPDRWVVLRLSAGRTPAMRRVVRGWVLEAGNASPVVTDLDAWKEPGTATDVVKSLTALGHGDLSWAGYFDNVVNRLGFYDASLDSDEVRGPISYLVCGWYSDPTADPLGSQAVTSISGFNEQMQQLGWSIEVGELQERIQQSNHYAKVAVGLGYEVRLDSRIAPKNNDFASRLNFYVTDGSWWPSSTLLHGAVVGIDWPGGRDTQEVGGPPAASAITVAIGNTMGETMGSLVARANAAPDEAAIVEALQLGVLKELDQPDGRAQLDVQLHASSFGSVAGSEAATEPFRIAPSGPPPAATPSTPTPGPGIFADTQSQGGGSVASHVALKLKQEQLAGQLIVTSGSAKGGIVEERIISGRLSAVAQRLGIGATPPASDPGATIDALRAAPRLYTPKDPVLLVQGGKRAFVHDSTVFSEDGFIVCRLTPVSELSWTAQGVAGRQAVQGRDILDRGVENGSIPVECEGLLDETALLDPGSADAAVAAAAATSSPTAGYDAVLARVNVTVEQTVIHTLRDPRVDHAPVIAYSGIAGRLPAAFAISLASRPWTPMHFDWTVEFLPSPNGERDWDLEEVDFTLDPASSVPAAGTGTTYSGRAALTGGAASTLASAIRNVLQQAAAVAGTGAVPLNGLFEAHYSALAETLTTQYQKLMVKGSGATPPKTPPSNQTRTPQSQSETDTSALGDIATALGNMDVLSCALDGLITQMRAGIPGDGRSTAPDGTPNDFIAMRAGFLRIVRLRLVDGFGQFVDLCGSDATHPAQGMVVSGPLTVAGQNGLAGLPPRFTAPARAWFRYMSADQAGVAADYETSPVCGFLMPNHLEGSLEFFNADGSGAGSLEPRPDGRVIWEDAPGTVTAAGQDPTRALSNTHAAQFASSLIDWGIADAGETREPALSALLRTIDSTLWAVDPFGHAGDEHLGVAGGSSSMCDARIVAARRDRSDRDGRHHGHCGSGAIGRAHAVAGWSARVFHER